MMRFAPKGQPLFAALILIAWIGASAAVRADGRRLVVVLYPQDSNAAVGHLLAEQGIRSAFATEPIDVYNEYLELSNSPTNRSSQLQVQFLREKYAGRKVDLVLAWLSPSLDFATTHRAEIFPGCPNHLLHGRGTGDSGTQITGRRDRRTSQTRSRRDAGSRPAAASPDPARLRRLG
jgi:hypothetical protein